MGITPRKSSQRVGSCSSAEDDAQARAATPTVGAMYPMEMRDASCSAAAYSAIRRKSASTLVEANAATLTARIWIVTLMERAFRGRACARGSTPG
jgi:hypothetical protein